MTNSLNEPGVLPRDGATRVTPAHNRELPSGSWTRLGTQAIRGDAVTEGVLADLAEQAKYAGRAQGYANGWAEGRRAAEDQARAEAAAFVASRELADRLRQDEHDQAVAALRQAAAQLHLAATQICAAVESQATDLALRLLAELLGRELAVAADPGADAVRRALQLLPDEPVITVRLHPADLAGAAGQVCPQGARIIPDANLTRGDAVVETDRGVLDARLSTAVERVAEVWK